MVQIYYIYSLKNILYLDKTMQRRSDFHFPSKNYRSNDSNLIFMVTIWILGAGLLGTLLYAITNFEKNESITQHMIDSLAYRLTLSSFVLLHCIIWALCIYRQSHIDYVISLIQGIVLAGIVVTWTGLAIFLVDYIHTVFVVTFLIMIILTLFMVSIMTQDYLSKSLLITGAVALIVGGIFMYVYVGGENFYIAEYVTFMVYAVIFTAFFTILPESEWDAAPSCYVAHRADHRVFPPNEGASAGVYNVTDEINPSVPLLVIHQSHTQNTNRPVNVI